MLLDDRRRWLANRAALWVLVIGMSSDKTRLGNPDMLREVETHLYGSHMSVLGLHHLHNCLCHLEALGTDFPAETRKLVKSFKAQYTSADVKRVRDALEHEEDRVAGLNLHRRPAYGGGYPDPLMTGGTAKARRMTMIRVLDEDFELSGVITAALALETPLRELEKRLWPA